MRILIDADGCPVVDLTVGIAVKSGIECIILCDTSHEFKRDGAETIVVEKGADSVDFKLVNLVREGDVVVTQDYGLAAMCLAKGAYVINQDGKEYTSDNISGLLEFRAIHKKIRRSGGHFKGMPKRTEAQDKAFEKAFEELVCHRPDSGDLDG